MPSSASASTLTARIRKVSGESHPFLERRGRGSGVAARAVAGSPATRVGAAPARGRASLLSVAVTISDAIERLDLREVVVDRLELLPQALDVAVDRAVVDIDVLA